MTAEPNHDPEGPEEILRLLPERWHREFHADYRAALDAARDVGQWRHLRGLLHRWRLLAVAYSRPTYHESAAAVRHATTEEMEPVPGLEQWLTR